MKNPRQITSRILHGRWDWNPRKTHWGMARRYQGVVLDARTLCKHLGAVKNRMEKIRGMRGRQQRALGPWIAGWMAEHITICCWIVFWIERKPPGTARKLVYPQTRRLSLFHDNPAYIASSHLCFDMFLDPDKVCVAYGMTLISSTGGEIW